MDTLHKSTVYLSFVRQTDRQHCIHWSLGAKHTYLGSLLW